jgi:D-serine deaminase-like pyridoxal phosphate-dependent protein
VAGLNEIRPGTYIFNDKNTWHMEACAFEDCAASIVTTVISTARPRQVIVDGGSKTFSSDRLAGSSEVSFGHVVEAPGAVFSKINEEHGFIDLRNAAEEFSVGDRVRIIPNHICVAMNLHEQVYGVRGDEVVETWKVAGRGKLQ